jgi:hypothetical protein
MEQGGWLDIPSVHGVPKRDGSPALTKTMGIVDVTAFAASAE